MDRNSMQQKYVGEIQSSFGIVNNVHRPNFSIDTMSTGVNHGKFTNLPLNIQVNEEQDPAFSKSTQVMTERKKAMSIFTPRDGHDNSNKQAYLFQSVASPQDEGATLPMMTLEQQNFKPQIDQELTSLSTAFNNAGNKQLFNSRRSRVAYNNLMGK